MLAENPLVLKNNITKIKGAESHLYRHRIGSY
jgi:hypothetical protein